MTMLNLMLFGLLFASCITLFVVVVTLLQAKARYAGQPGERPRSALTRIIISIAAFVVWFFLSFLLTVGHNRGATGIRGFLWAAVMYGALALYVYLGFRQYQLWRLRPPELEKDNSTD